MRTALTDRLIGIDAEQLQAVPEVIAFVYGTAKADAVRAAMHGGVTTSLVTHTSLATALLDAGVMTDAGRPKCSCHGGITNAGRVSRVGDTVRRPRRPTSPATHALLDHLERVGFDGAPRFLGADEQGREVLSLIPGEAAMPPYAGWALTDEALVSVAELLRRYHDAAALLRRAAPHVARACRRSSAAAWPATTTPTSTTSSSPAAARSR